MTESPGTAVHKNDARWRWLLYVGLAIAGAMLTFIGARAQQRAAEDAAFRKLIDSYCAAWSTGTADAPAKFYAQDDGLVFYDSVHRYLGKAGRKLGACARASLQAAGRKLES